MGGEAAVMEPEDSSDGASSPGSVVLIHSS